MPRLILISDTHDIFYPELPEGDILIHAGDVSLSGGIEETGRFFRWFRAQPHKYKICIGGNHDAALASLPVIFSKTGIDYLNDSFVDVDGLRIAGSPVSRKFGHICAFAKFGQELDRHWENLDHSDILVTHGPPYGILDTCSPGEHNLGDEALRVAVERIKPKVHVFGHIHGGYGIKELNGTTFVNAAILDESYNGTHEPLVIEI